MEKWVCTWIMSSTIQNIYNNQNYPLLCATHWMQCCGIVATSFQRKHYYGHEHIFVEGPLKLMPYVVFINHSGCGSAGRMGCPAACWSIIEQYAEPINWTQIWEQSYSNCEEVEYMKQSYCMKSSYSTTTGRFWVFFCSLTRCFVYLTTTVNQVWPGFYPTGTICMSYNTNFPMLSFSLMCKHP